MPHRSSDLQKFVAGLALAACFAGVSARADASIDAAPPPFRAASERDYPPFSIVDDDGRAGGFSVELMHAALGAMGRTVDFKTGTWVEVMEMLERGGIDALPLVGRTPEREGRYDFSVPYLTMHGVIVARADDTVIRTMADLRGRSVAVMQGDHAEEFLRREDRGIAIAPMPSFVEALRSVSEGRHDAVVIPQLVALRLLQKSGLQNLQVLPKSIQEFRQEFCFAVRQGDHKTLALLNEGLALVVADGTHRRLHAKWFASLELPGDRRLIFGGDAGFPPFEFLNAKGRPEGFAVDITRAIARETGLDIEIRLGVWSDILEGVRQGDIDAIQGIFYTPERGAWLRFSPGFLTSQYVAITRRGTRPPETLDELAGRALVVQRKDLVHDYLLEQKVDARIAAHDSLEDALRTLAENRHEIALGSQIAALHLIQQNGWTNLTVGARPILSSEYCYAVPSGSQALLAQISEGLLALEKSGEYHRIYNKWMSVYDKGRVSLRTVFWYVLGVLIPLGVILVVALATAAFLRRQVVLRTAELMSSESRYRSLFHNDHTSMLLIDPESGALIDANPAVSRFYGWSEEELRSMTLDRIDARTPALILEDLRRSPRRGQDSFVFLSRLRDGTVRHVELFAAPVSIEDRELLFAVLHDVTSQVQAEGRAKRLNRILQAIREVDQLIARAEDPHRFISQACRLLVEHRNYLEATILRIDARNGTVIDHTHKGRGGLQAALKGLQEADGIPACFALQAGEDFKSVGTATDCAESPAAPGDCGSVVVFRLAHGPQTFGYFLVRSADETVMDDEEQDLLLQMASDMGYALHALETQAAHERIQQQLLQSQKMESVGRLAGGVAHDFNNMLMGIMGYAELSQDELPKDHPVQDLLRQILTCAKRSAKLTRQLLAFARKQPVDPKVLNLNVTIEAMLSLLQRLLGEDIQLVWLPCPDLWRVRLDPGQIDQLLANLCVNARDAIPGVGKVTVETGNIEIADDCDRSHSEIVPGCYVRLTVTDNGGGMDRKVREHLFEPFFTTKAVGEGSGLGLAMVHGIVKQNLGFIDVESEPGRGSTFKIYLPRTEEEEADETPPTTCTGLLPPPPAPTGGETILLVEDEASVLESTRRFLEGAGYKVLAASTPVDAIRIAKDHRGTIALLLTDVVMPEMNGRDLARSLLETDPCLRCLFMSGYTANATAHEGILEKGVDFLSKPFGRRELLRKVHETLAGGSEPGGISG